MSKKVVYESKNVELSREYPFGEHNVIGTGDDKKKVTVLTLTELNGNDNVAMSKQVEAGKLVGYLQIAVSAGIEYEDALMLADKDSTKLAEAIADF